MDKNFYITTPIYYPSAKPHMGHAYSSIIADFFARFKKIDGFKVHFLTGTDEHGLKIQRSAEKKGLKPLQFCDEISKTFRNLSEILNLTNTDFIRTTENRHKTSVQHLWKELEKNDDIYLSKYSGWYSVSDEAFYSEDEIEEINGSKVAVSSKSAVEWVDEESYFFRLSKWEKPLLEFYEKNPGFISPESRKNEVVSFVKSGLKDLSISRKSFSWGIKVPGNENHVIYVWLDALTNYISALNYPNTKEKLFKSFWPASIHLIGKDPQIFCDQISQTFRDLSKTLNLINTDFIRTTEERHKKTVQHLWKELEKNDDIYLSNYSGWYSVSDEAFYNEDEIYEINGNKIAKSSKSPVEWIEEESYFFRLSKWEKPLLEYYNSNPDFIAPESRRNEVISFVKGGLKDLSVVERLFRGV